ncbi:glycosyltransferase family 2 protein [uncultured Methanomethylovorans sp.]|uniref:glycosyltransferase family 2 protein n=1 Tax=uncultured Methanomethylovorans sp. TaxID=183759 RepID=UPI002AA72ED2|nr:glycosyltransferase family 2 protein [uncultured Methanomethylovorans sp.]
MDNNINFVSIILLTYNSALDLPECVPSLLSQTYGNFEIIIVDNASSDGTVEFIHKNYPQLKLIEAGKNLGYPSGNNLGFEYARGNYVVVVNPDTVADSQWLTELIKPLDEDSSITATTSKIKIYYDTDKINACGDISHYTGLTFCKGLHAPSDSFSQSEEIGAVAGGSFAIRREMLDYIKGFDSDFFLYMEDTDLSWRVRFAGGKLVYVPTSIIYHKFKLSIAAWKHFYLERNRYMMLLKNLETKTLLLLLPGLVLTEIVTMGHATLNGPEYIRNKFKAYWWIVNNRNIIFEHRKKTLATKKISDKEFFQLIEWRVPYEQIIKNKTLLWCADKLFNTAYRLHFTVAKRLI